METYRVLLFDIDNTLLDFTAGAMQSMEAIFLEAGLAYTPEMFGVFQTENDKLWARIERGELTIAGLRDVRWQTILACLGLEADGAAMEDAFRIRLHESAVPVAGARGCTISLRRSSFPGRSARKSRARCFLTAAWSTYPGCGRSSA